MAWLVTIWHGLSGVGDRRTYRIVSAVRASSARRRDFEQVAWVLVACDTRHSQGRVGLQYRQSSLDFLHKPPEKLAPLTKEHVSRV